jgi:hypothetical protein
MKLIWVITTRSKINHLRTVALSFDLYRDVKKADFWQYY